MSSSNISSQKQAAIDTARFNGTKKYWTGQTSILVESVAYTPAKIVAIYQGDLDAMTAVTAAHLALSEAQGDRAPSQQRPGQPPWFSARVRDIEGQFYAPTSRQGAGGSIEASLLVGTLAPCVRYWLAVACVDLSLGQLEGSGTGFDQSHDGNTFYAAVGLRAGLEFPLGRTFALRLMVEGQTPLRPTQLKVNGFPVWSTPSAWRWPRRSA